MKRFNNRAYRRDIEKRKYISRLKKNLYWLWLDKDGKQAKVYASASRPESWVDLQNRCKFAKKFKNGGNPERRSMWEKIYNKRQSEERNSYPQDKIEMDLDEINMLTDENWEDYCAACDKFETDSCPHKGNVDLVTNWKKEIVCDKFDN